MVSTNNSSIFFNTSSFPSLVTLEKMITLSPTTKSKVSSRSFLLFSRLLAPTLSALVATIVTGI